MLIRPEFAIASQVPAGAVTYFATGLSAKSSASSRSLKEALELTNSV